MSIFRVSVILIITLVLLPFSIVSSLADNNNVNVRFSKLDRTRPLISPSVAKADFCHLLADCQGAVVGGADMLHFSVQDGRMVPKISFGSPIISSLRPHLDVCFDVKLGCIEPEQRIKEFVKVGADIISFHPEATLQPAAAVHMISSAGCVPGLVINPGLPIESIFAILDQVQVVVIMLVNPGYGGPKYIDGALDKIRKLKKVCKERGLNPIIEVDGGVNTSNCHLFLEAGATCIIAGGSVFKSEGRVE